MILTTKILDKLLNSDYVKNVYPMIDHIDTKVVWDGDEALSMKNIPKSFDIQVGDEVLTSNYSNRFPANIRIGTVSETRDDGVALFRKVIVKPSVNFTTLEQVFVIKQLPDNERYNLEKDSSQRGIPIIKSLKKAK
jgi:cell shape-determining protein MreC